MIIQLEDLQVMRDDEDDDVVIVVVGSRTLITFLGWVN